jgi:hypothetical protein
LGKEVLEKYGKCGIVHEIKPKSMKKVIGILVFLMVLGSSCRKVQRYQPPKPAHVISGLLVAPDSILVQQEIVEEI